jgi:sortase (surface protein transpeptidase)
VIAPAAPVAADELPPTPQTAGDSPPAVVQTTADDQPAEAPAPDVAAAVPVVPMGVPPVKISIPSLGVEAIVEAVAEDPDGAMSAPSDPDEVAWYRLGPGMGVPGNAVFAGHINWAGRTRAFGFLERLDLGDVIQVIDAQGRGFEYAVESSRWVRAEGAPIEEIFAQPTEPVITLITCGGEYVASRREYLDRLVVRARGA